MRLIGKLRKKGLTASVQSRHLAYKPSFSHTESLDFQLLQFNQIWKSIRRYVPFYTRLAQEHHLPEQFSDWDSFIKKMPLTNRETVQAFGAQMSDCRRKQDFVRTTGGTTAQPIQIPAWYAERSHTNPDQWLGRSWYGIEPDDKLFMIWGHSHLLGRGVTGWKNRVVRNIKDKLLGYCRFSAYDLSEKNMRRAGEKMLAFRPRYVIGYSTALDIFARVNQDRAEAFGKLNLKAAIATAEGFPVPESASFVGGVLGCPIAMEYGSVETQVIAHTHPEGHYRVFWQSYFLEASLGEQGHSVLVTSLYNRCFPLIRYQLGDEIELESEKNTYGIRNFQRVLGRCNDWVLLDDGFKVHSEVFTHVLRSCPKIKQFQVVVTRQNVSIHYLAQESLNAFEKQDIGARFEKIHPDLKRVVLLRVEHLKQSVSGKTPMIYQLLN